MPECKTLQTDNRFTFACPIFGASVELRGCLRLHEHQMVGRPVEVRQGCQAAMASSKCPVWSMHQMMRHGRDDWHATDTTVRSLGEDVIARIERVQTLDMHLNRYSVPARERELLDEANAMWTKGVKKPSKFQKGSSAPVELSRISDAGKSGSASASAPDDELMTAASTGNLGAAISAAAQAEVRAGRSCTPKRSKPAQRAPQAQQKAPTREQ